MDYFDFMNNIDNHEPLEYFKERTGTEDRGKIYDDLLTVISSRKIQPEDHLEIAAILESTGWNDEKVIETFGVHDVFDLSQNLWEIMQSHAVSTSYVSEDKPRSLTVFYQAIRNFIRGAVFALPMAISVFAMLGMGFSLWSYVDLSVELATCIAIGTILSFVLVGGFTQSIARKGFFYMNQHFYNVGGKITSNTIKTGFALCFVVAVSLLVFNLLFEIFTFPMMLIINIFFVLLMSLWLSVTVMYTLRKELVFTGLLAVGIALVYVFFRLLNLHIILSQAVSLTIVSTAGILITCLMFLYYRRKYGDTGAVPALPRFSFLAYSVTPYFIYGFLYFAFLFMDRVIAWSVNVDSVYLIWFRGPYELGLDLALLTLIIPMGLNEVIIGDFMLNLRASQKEYTGDRTAELNGKYRKMYIKRFVLVLIISFAVSVAIYILIRYIGIDFIIKTGTGLVSNPVTRFVFTVALPAYSMLSVSLMNAVILFSLSQADMVNKALTPALITNIVVGFVLSRWMTFLPNSYVSEKLAPWLISLTNTATGYGYAVLGLAAGSAVFLVLSTRQVLRVLKNLDYYLFYIT